LEFALTTAPLRQDLRPRKTPVQRRSEATVEAIFDAAIQVLQITGYRSLTTTRVAERAGVSVGTLYQYYPNKQALVAALLVRFLARIETTLMDCCRTADGRDLAAVSTILMDAYLAIKLERPEVSAALHEPMNGAVGAEMAQAARQRITAALAELLDRCSDVAFPDPETTATILVATVGALGQTAVDSLSRDGDLAVIRRHANALILGYLRAVSVAR
jgi:AcrR family transcriptional regulator